MFERIFGVYLIRKGKLSKEQMAILQKPGDHSRVKLGVIAVAEKFMTQQEADEVNRLQSITDRRFGDIAIEKGYLNEAQVESLIKRQGNAFLHFLQSVIEEGFYTLDELDGFISDYQEEMGFTQSDMDDLLSGDILREVGVYMPGKNTISDGLMGVAVRTFLRLIDSGAYVGKAYFTDELSSDRFTSQTMTGDHHMVTGFAGDGDDLLCVANVFAGEEFEEVDLDALDAVAEFVNCVDGMYAAALSNESVNVDMLPPEYYDSKVKIKGNQFLVLPVVSGDSQVALVVSVDNELTVDKN